MRSRRASWGSSIVHSLMRVSCTPAAFAYLQVGFISLSLALWYAWWPQGATVNARLRTHSR